LGDAALTRDLARLANDSMAELCRRHPDRFLGFAAALPMNDPDASVEETARAVRDLGALGVQIYTNVNGVPLDDPRYAPLFARVAREGALRLLPHVLRRHGALRGRPRGRVRDRVLRGRPHPLRDGYAFRPREGPAVHPRDDRRPRRARGLSRRARRALRGERPPPAAHPAPLNMTRGPSYYPRSLIPR